MDRELLTFSGVGAATPVHVEDGQLGAVNMNYDPSNKVRLY